MNITNNELNINHKVVYLSRLLRERFRQEMGKQGLFFGQNDLLMRIGENPGITPTGLAKQMDLSLASVSVSLSRIEKAGFIEKKADEKDGRTSRLYLLSSGCDLRAHLVEDISRTQKDLVNGMSESEQAILSELLGKAICNMGGSEEEFFAHCPMAKPEQVQKEEKGENNV